MAKVGEAIRRSLTPDIDRHPASFLGREVAGLPGPVWSLVAWNVAMLAVSALNALALAATSSLTELRLAFMAYWAVSTVLIIVGGRRVPGWAIHLAVDLNIIAVCVIAATAPNEVRATTILGFLVVAAVYVATWMPRPRMLLHLGTIVLAVTLVVAVLGLDADTIRIWFSTVGVCVGLAYFVNALVTHLNTQAIMDPLTGLLNRAGLDLVIAAQDRPGAARERAIAVIDLDGFKEVNDTRGHAAGDELLRQVGQCLRTHLRPADAIVRTGGDEFLVVLTRTDAGQAEVVVRRVVAHFPIGCSVGVVDWPAGTDLDSAVTAADRRMYAEKADHRRRDDPPIRGTD